MQAAASGQSGKWSIAAGLSLIFVALSLARIPFHEMWRDEIAPWALAQLSQSVSDVAEGRRYSGHPMTWNLLVYLVCRLGGSLWTVQVIHVLIASAAVYVVLKFAALTRLQQVLFPFGYYFFFEYSAIARAYALGVLLTFIACTLIRGQPRRWLLLGVVLFLLCQTSVFGVIIAAGFGAALLAEAYVARRRGGSAPAIPALAFTILSIAAGAVLSALQMIPPPDGSYAPGWRTTWDPLVAGRCIVSVWKAYVPLPQIGVHFWNTNILDDIKPLQAALGLLLCLWIPLTLRKSPAAFAFWITSTSGTLLFFYVKYLGFQRNIGQMFIIWLAAIWLAQDGRQEVGARRQGLLTCILAAHAYSGIYATTMDLVHPFSSAGAVARRFEDLNVKDPIVVAHADHAGLSVAARMRTPFYYPASGRFSIRIVHGAHRRKHVDAEELWQTALKLRATFGREVYLLVNYPIAPPGGFEAIDYFGPSIVASEEYYLYRTDK